MGALYRWVVSYMYFIVYKQKFMYAWQSQSPCSAAAGVTCVGCHVVRGSG